MPDDTVADDEPPDAEELESDAPETGPLRRCAITRERLPKEQMIRFVIAPDRSVIPDLHAKLPGRGIWLSARRDVIERAQAAPGGLARVFAKAARGPVIVPTDLSSVLQAGLVRRIGELLGLARRAGQAVAGFTKARDWIDRDRAGLVIEARDGSADERARFLSGRTAVTVIAPLDSAALGAIFGRDHAVHVAVAHGRLADALTIEAARLAGLETTEYQAAGTGRIPRDGRAGQSG